MDSESIVYLVVFLIWVASQALSALKKASRRQRGEPAPSSPPPRSRRERTPPPPVEEVGPEPQVRGMLDNLARVEREMESSLPEMDEGVRAQATFFLEHGFRDEAKRLREEIESALTQGNYPKVGSELENAHELLSASRELLHAANIHSGLRRRTDSLRPQAVADRLVDEFYSRFRPFADTQRLPLAQGPPVALVWDLSAGDRLARSPLTSSTLFVPRSVTTDPSHWALFSHELSRYLAATAPTVYQEIYDRLELGVSEGSVGGDPASLTKVLFASWVVRLFGDAVGTSFFGPAYVDTLARLHAQPQTPTRVTTIYLDQDGTVNAEPPAHVRVHLAAQWLSEMGYPTEAERIRVGWDEWHREPKSFHFFGSMGSLPAAPVLEAATALGESFYHLELEALGVKKLAEVPGLDDWRAHQGPANEAKSSLIAGERATGSARSLVAATMEASNEAPEAAVQIRNALYESVEETRPVPTRRRAAKPIAKPRVGTPWVAPTGRDVAEALIVAEVLLERRR